MTHRDESQIKAFFKHQRTNYFYSGPNEEIKFQVEAATTDDVTEQYPMTAA